MDEYWDTEFDELEDIPLEDTEDRAGSIPVEDIDVDQIAEAALTLLASFLYHRSDQEEKLASLLVMECQMQEEYLEQELFMPTILRQAAFIEYFLVAELLEEFEDLKGEPLSNSEKKFIKNQLGNSGRQRLVSMLGVLEESEEQAVNELIGARNDIGHQPWIVFSEDDRQRFERVATRVHNIFEDMSKGEELSEELSARVVEEFED